MALIILTTKVKRFKEDDFEWDDESMGSNPNKVDKWTWKRRAIDADSIYDVTEINSAMCTIEDMYGKKVLVNESFDDVFNKWKDNKTCDLVLDDSETDEKSEEDED